MYCSINISTTYRGSIPISCFFNLADHCHIGAPPLMAGHGGIEQPLGFCYFRAHSPLGCLQTQPCDHLSYWQRRATTLLISTNVMVW